MDRSVIQQIGNDCGLAVTSFDRVHGGDINEAFCLHTDKGRYFLKLNDASKFPAMFEKEADGLNALGRSFALSVPQVVANGVVNDTQYLLLEWLDRGDMPADTWETFGRALATMHRKSEEHFGWHTNNYIGSLRQLNKKHQTWNVFFSECRVLPLVECLYNAGKFTRHDIKAAEHFCSQTVFPDEQPALLHGDLWSGNFMITSHGAVAIYDPAVYFGHREMDIAMTILFGGFDARFYQAYNEVYPLAAGWNERLPVSQLYPLLVHAALFGGHYIGNVREIIARYGQ